MNAQAYTGKCRYAAEVRGIFARIRDHSLARVDIEKRPIDTDSRWNRADSGMLQRR